jgi:hypothetical protein
MLHLSSGNVDRRSDVGGALASSQQPLDEATACPSINRFTSWTSATEMHRVALLSLRANNDLALQKEARQPP